MIFVSLPPLQPAQQLFQRVRMWSTVLSYRYVMGIRLLQPVQGNGATDPPLRAAQAPALQSLIILMWSLPRRFLQGFFALFCPQDSTCVAILAQVQVGKLHTTAPSHVHQVQCTLCAPLWDHDAGMCELRRRCCVALKSRFVCRQPAMP